MVLGKAIKPSQEEPSFTIVPAPLINSDTLEMIDVLKCVSCGHSEPVCYFITLGKEYYHLHPQLERWCRDNLGPGRWGSYKEVPEDANWVISGIFGYLTYRFKDEATLNYFRESNDLLSISDNS
jgi:hypothetical protein